MTIAQLRDAYSTAAAALHEAADAFQAADPDTSEEDLAALQERFDAAETAADEARVALEAQERVEAARARTPVPVVPDTDPGDGDEPSPSEVRVTSEEPVYRRDRPERSFFQDAYAARVMGDQDAAERLRRNTAQVAERYDLNSTDGTGGYFVPPAWLQDEFLVLARASRPFANAVRRLPLPPNTDSINIPGLATGAAVAAQSDLGAVQETDATDMAVTAPVRTIAGQQDFSRQLFDRSTPGVDAIIGADLEAAYNTQVDVQALNGSGSAPNARGVLNVAGVIGVTYTDASPTVPELYPKLADAIQQIHTNRFLSPTAIVMHPRRWAWFLASLDTAGRPLVTPYAPSNAAGLIDRVGAESVVGSLHGLPVIVDASIPTNLGGGTNEDRILITRLEDLYLWEAGVNQATYFEVLSQNLAVRIQRWGYFAFSGERYPKATAVISGTGLVTPTF